MQINRSQILEQKRDTAPRFITSWKDAPDQRTLQTRGALQGAGGGRALKVFVLAVTGGGKAVMVRGLAVAKPPGGGKGMQVHIHVPVCMCSNVRQLDFHMHIQHVGNRRMYNLSNWTLASPSLRCGLLAKPPVCILLYKGCSRPSGLHCKLALRWHFIGQLTAGGEGRAIGGGYNRCTREGRGLRIEIGP